MSFNRNIPRESRKFRKRESRKIHIIGISFPRFNKFFYCYSIAWTFPNRITAKLAFIILQYNQEWAWLDPSRADVSSFGLSLLIPILSTPLELNNLEPKIKHRNGFERINEDKTIVKHNVDVVKKEISTDAIEKAVQKVIWNSFYRLILKMISNIGRLNSERHQNISWFMDANLGNYSTVFRNMGPEIFRPCRCGKNFKWWTWWIYRWLIVVMLLQFSWL